MAEENVPTPEPTQEQEVGQSHGDPTDWKAMARKWEAQSKANNERIKELEAKAQKYDEYEASQKSELERAQDGLTKARSEADEWKAKYEAIEAEQSRAREVAKMSAKYRVNAGTLARMSGDVEDNAKYLAELETTRPKFGATRDMGDSPAPEQTLEERLRGVKSTSERIRIREEWNAEHNSK